MESVVWRAITGRPFRGLRDSAHNLLQVAENEKDSQRDRRLHRKMVGI